MSSTAAVPATAGVGVGGTMVRTGKVRTDAVTKRPGKMRRTWRQTRPSHLTMMKWKPDWLSVPNLLMRRTALWHLTVCCIRKCEFNFIGEAKFYVFCSIQNLYVTSAFRAVFIVVEVKLLSKSFLTHLFFNNFIDHLTDWTIRYITQAKAWQTEPQ